MKNVILISLIIIALALLGATTVPCALYQKKNSTQKKADPEKKADILIYTCTIHPEVTQNKPGKCPKCGRKLVMKEIQKQREVRKIRYIRPIHRAAFTY
jgi:hypothetical protein